MAPELQLRLWRRKMTEYGRNRAEGLDRTCDCGTARIRLSGQERRTRLCLSPRSGNPGEADAWRLHPLPRWPCARTPAPAAARSADYPNRPPLESHLRRVAL